MRIIQMYLYDDGSDETPLVIIDPPDNFDTLCKEWRHLDYLMTDGDDVGDDWLPFSEWMRRAGVNIPEVEESNINNSEYSSE